jgi:Flp pilus assembly protein TadG
MNDVVVFALGRSLKQVTASRREQIRSGVNSKKSEATLMKFRCIRETYSDETGSVMVEAGFVIPLLIFVALGAIQFSIIMNLYATATSAAAAGLQTFNTYRAVAGAYTAGVNAATTAAKLTAWKMSSSDISIQFWIGTTSCTGTSCDTLLAANVPDPVKGTAGAPTKVEVQLACKGLNLLPSLPSVGGILKIPSLCPVIVQMSGVIQ